jgi:hypothetical protein
MPISVLCPSCKARFQVSEKFAGKQGPCPKCKAPITIPKVEEQVQIHAPEAFAAGGKTATGEAVMKPITRKEAKLELIPTVIAACGALTVLAIAFFAGKTSKIFSESFALRAVALLAVSVPLTVAGYAFLRNDELEPHRGRWLWVRAAICGLGFSLLWLGFSFIPVDLRSSTWSYFMIAPVFLSIGAGIAFGCYDLDFGNGFLLCCFYTAATLALGWLAGLEMPWSVITTR